MGLRLPTVLSPIASYMHVVKTGNLLFLAGKGPQQANGEYIKGKLGTTLTTKQGMRKQNLLR